MSLVQVPNSAKQRRGGGGGNGPRRETPRRKKISQEKNTFQWVGIISHVVCHFKCRFSNANIPRWYVLPLWICQHLGFETNSYFGPYSDPRAQNKRKIRRSPKRISFGSVITTKKLTSLEITLIKTPVKIGFCTFVFFFLVISPIEKTLRLKLWMSLATIPPQWLRKRPGNDNVWTNIFPYIQTIRSIGTGVLDTRPACRSRKPRNKKKATVRCVVKANILVVI